MHRERLEKEAVLLIRNLFGNGMGHYSRTTVLLSVTAAGDIYPQLTQGSSDDTGRPLCVPKTCYAFTGHEGGQLMAPDNNGDQQQNN